MKDNGSRMPQIGEQLILADGRRFVLRDFAVGARGWWFKAESQDGGSVLEGNLALAWDEHACAWCPKSSRHTSPPPFSARDRTKQA